MPESDDGAVTDADFEAGRTALLEITTADTIGERAGSRVEDDNVVTVFFETTLAGYPGWHWTVSIAHVDGVAPSALETELTPGEDALLSPAWIPWVDRLADYRAAQDALGAEDVEDDSDDDDDFDSALLHAGDLDGVDIDEDDFDDHIADDDELTMPLATVGVEDADEPEGDSGDAGPEPPEVIGGNDWDEHEENNKSY